MAQPNHTDDNTGAELDAPLPGPVPTRFYKTWWFWLAIIVLAGGFVLYVRTWTRATHLDFTPQTNPPPPVATPAPR